MTGTKPTGSITAGILADDRLANGLRLLCRTLPGSPVASVTLVTRVGSAYERVGERGYAHLLEHLMFHGSERLPRGEYDRICTMAGGESNAWTSTDLTGYWIAVPSESLPVALALEAARATGPTLEIESFENERRIVEAERRQVIENVPYGEAGRLVREALYPEDHPYRHEPIGDPDDLAKATIGSISSFFRRHYRADRSILVVAADRPLHELRHLAEQHFGEAFIEDADHPAEVFQESDRTASAAQPTGPRHRTILSQLVPLSASFLAWQAPSTNDRRVLALELLAMILAEGDGSRLAVAMEYTTMIASETGAWIEEGERGSTFNVWGIARTVRTGPEEIRDGLLAALRQIVSGGITDNELTTVRNRKLASVVSSLTSMTTTAERLAVYTALYDDPALVWNEPAAYEKVTGAEIVDEARKLLATDPVILDYRPEA